MKETGHDLPSLYKETSEGGLAKNFIQMGRRSPALTSECQLKPK
jgi:hypothetical protein